MKRTRSKKSRDTVPLKCPGFYLIIKFQQASPHRKQQIKGNPRFSLPNDDFFLTGICMGSDTKPYMSAFLKNLTSKGTR
jgi:hypothetical protein